MTAAYLVLSQNELQKRADLAYEIYRSCRVCPHAFEINRIDWETGFCGQLDTLHVFHQVFNILVRNPL